MKEEWTEIKGLKIPSSLEQGKPFLTQIQIGRKRICILKSDKLYAMDAKCPHANGPLVAGFINDEGKIVCPWHRFAFDLKTGQSDSGGYCLNMYKIKEKKDGSFWIRFSQKPWYKFW